VTVPCFPSEYWPRTCPKPLATVSVVGPEQHYTFHHKNVPSGEEFEMTLKTRRSKSGGEEKVTEARLKFY
jgi:hypothetical protein